MRGPSRRDFLGGAAGVVAAAAIPAPSIGAPSATRQATSARRPATALAATALAGATVGGTGGVVAEARTFDGYIGMPLGTTIQKIYMGYSSFPSTPPSRMTQLAKAGCQFVVDVIPSTTMTAAEQTALANWLTMMNSSGLNYRVVLYAEANNKAFASAADWNAYWSFYAPVIQSAGVSCGYDAGCSGKAILRAEQYFPVSPTPDELWMDYYCTSFRGGSRLEPLIGQAQAVGIPSGLAEWGWTSGNVVFTPTTMPWWDLYCSYLVHLISTGLLGLGTIYFDEVAHGRTGNFIGSADDPRIPGIQRVAQAVPAAS